MVTAQWGQIRKKEKNHGIQESDQEAEEGQKAEGNQDAGHRQIL
jgi:hypothetical protein